MCHLMENTIWCTMIPWCSGCHMFTPYAYLIDTEAACTTGRLLFNTNPSTSVLHLECILWATRIISHLRSKISGDDVLLLPLTIVDVLCSAQHHKTRKSPHDENSKARHGRLACLLGITEIASTTGAVQVTCRVPPRFQHLFLCFH